MSSFSTSTLFSTPASMDNSTVGAVEEVQGREGDVVGELLGRADEFFLVQALCDTEQALNMRMQFCDYLDGIAAHASAALAEKEAASQTQIVDWDALLMEPTGQQTIHNTPLSVCDTLESEGLATPPSNCIEPSWLTVATPSRSTTPLYAADYGIVAPSDPAMPTKPDVRERMVAAGFEPEGSIAKMRELFPTLDPVAAAQTILDLAQQRGLLPTVLPAPAAGVGFPSNGPPLPTGSLHPASSTCKRKRTPDQRTQAQEFVDQLPDAVRAQLFRGTTVTTVPCAWTGGCGAFVESSANELREHIHGVHGAPRRGALECRWGACTTRLDTAESLRKHLGKRGHPAPAAGRCALCGQSLARADTVRRHLESCAVVRLEAGERAARFAAAGVPLPEEGVPLKRMRL
ncbi:hypothetical protein FA95DRAFT_1572503 [Auriscalpium vulgare]|uniref:Uncharacterized protein n=1 Tax=Auriscalpium vulgare TaxID=40419 RepID=A0ACB8RTU4_9AGAM|nr:hypothetical protein FA95DRAFT_1572503 [Auriscalpium vulgare]